MLSEVKPLSRCSEVLDTEDTFLTKEPKMVARWASCFEELYKVDPTSSNLNIKMASALQTDQSVICDLPSKDEVHTGCKSVGKQENNPCL